MMDYGFGAVPDDAAMRALIHGIHGDVSFEVLSNTPSPSLGWHDVLRLAARIDEAATEHGIARFVVVQGTDTLEDVAFALDLLVPADARVVVTGAMYPSSHPEYDGVANLRDSVRVALDDAYHRDGVLVCMTGEVHRAAEAHKVAAQGVPAFRSVNAPIGTVSGGRTASRASAPQHRPLARTVTDVPRVPIVRATLGEDDAMLSSLPGDTRGIVIEGFGAGNLPAALRPTVAGLASRLPVVLATRIRPGSIIEGAYGYPGSQHDLAGLGVISAGALGADKARILLALLIASGSTLDDVVERFRMSAHG